MTWLPYMSTEGKLWWFNERCSLFCWDEDKADIYYSAMEINEPRYVAQLQQAATELGMGQAGLTNPMLVPVYVNPEPTLLDLKSPRPNSRAAGRGQMEKELGADNDAAGVGQCGECMQPYAPPTNCHHFHAATTEG